MIRFEKLRDDARCVEQYRFSIRDWQMARVKLSDEDNAFITEMQSTDSAADKLLALECIVRRMEEQDV